MLQQLSSLLTVAENTRGGTQASPPVPPQLHHQHIKPVPHKDTYSLTGHKQALLCVVHPRRALSLSFTAEILKQPCHGKGSSSVTTFLFTTETRQILCIYNCCASGQHIPDQTTNSHYLSGHQSHGTRHGTSHAFQVTVIASA